MIRLERVSKTYPDGTVAVHALDLDVARGELVVLVGPSGCGKTTTMRMVNRLIEPTTGRIWLDGEDVTHTDPVQLRRRIGYVIQQVGLFPHRTITQNVGTVPGLIGWERDRIAQRSRELLDLVGLEPDVYGPRYPHELSGGQRQRVGVARALAADPPVLLMDEPFGAVDPVGRIRLQTEFRRLQRRLGSTVILVTHDIDEAVLLGDRIAVMRQGGYLEQFDTPAQVLGAPATEFVASFVGADRGLKRLAVTPIADADLVAAPVVVESTPPAEAAADLARVGARWAVVVDGAGTLRGWVAAPDVEAAASHPSGTTGASLAGRVRRMEAWVPRDATLRTALAEMLQQSAGWVAVLDEGRYVGVLTPNSLHEALRRSVERDHELSAAGDPLR